MYVFNAASIMPKGMMAACIRHLVEYVDEFLIVESVDPKAKMFGPDGKSTDDTEQIVLGMRQKWPQIKWKPIGSIKAKEDRYAASNRIMQGDYVWLLDADEFYHEKDIPLLLKLLEDRRPYVVNYYANHFWGDWNHRVKHIKGQSWGNGPWFRIFKNNPGRSYWIENAPPLYMYEDGILCNDQKNRIDADELLEMGIKLYHYGFVQKSQIDFKHVFYQGGADYQSLWSEWQKNHNASIVLGTKTVPFDQSGHPLVIRKLIHENRH